MDAQPQSDHLPFHPRVPMERRGFALIVTISLMLLLTVIAVGLLTLSSISLRTATTTGAMAEARQNARLSMMLALAQLQLATGQDTRVTASANLLSPANVPVTGAWRSWEGSDHAANGKPLAPKYGLKKTTGDPAVPVAAATDGRFLGWLTSAAYGAAPDTSVIPNAASAATPGYVPMVSTGSVVDSSRAVYLKPTMVNGGGAIAWWTSGDNSKAMVNTDRTAKPATVTAWQQRVRCNGKADAKSFGLDKIDSYAPGTLVPSTGSLKFANPAAELRKIHDLTSYSRGLLTNTATGGWRRDLSIFSEKYASLPAAGLPLFTLSPGKTQTYSKAQPAAQPANVLLYPWATYRAGPTSSGWRQVPPICSWDALVDYTQQYRQLSTANASRTSMPLFVADCYAAASRYDFQEKVRRVPQIARIHWIYSLCSAVSSAANDTNSGTYGKYKPALMITPVLTLWNPYNVEITVPGYGIKIQETAPLRFKFKVGTTVYPETTLSEICKAGTGYERFNLLVSQAITLPPGGTRIFGLNDPQPKANSSASSVVLTPGYKPGGGFLFYGLNQGNNIYAAASDTFAVDKISYDATTTESGRSGIGILYDISVNGASLAHRMVYDATELGGDAVVAGLYPPLVRTASSTLSQVEGLKNLPFASAIFGYRMASSMPRDGRHDHLYARGMLQANPLCFYSEVGFGDTANAFTSMQGTGVYHPINAPYDFAFMDVDGWNDTLAIPQWESATGRSYIVSGMLASDGLTRCVAAELPTRPIQSLPDLQHFDARNNNPIPPFEYNLVGNGSAHPIFAPDQLFVASFFNNGMCNDDAYFLNHMLFDDWFVSSIAPEPVDFAASSVRPIETVYQDHLKQSRPLPNRFYMPAADAASPDVATAVNTAMSVTQDSATGMFSFESIASKLEVTGMFNINSVSLEAWKAVLRNNRDVQVPYLDANAATVGGNPSSFSFPRTSIAGDDSTASGSKISGSLNPLAAEHAGHRVLTDAQIDALAEEIVKEIQKRGPFLSLSEFVNRQVTTDKDLAIAATIQKALDTLANAGSSPKNPFAKLEDASVRITTSPPGTTDYKFPEAALGWSAFGVPGWVRQADIIRPLAPVMSARDDTFTIRAYGDSRDRKNTSVILAHACCEVVVKRQANYVDRSDAAAIAPFSAGMKSAVNKRFGRRYEIISFRWLADAEI